MFFLVLADAMTNAEKPTLKKKLDYFYFYFFANRGQRRSTRKRS